MENQVQYQGRGKTVRTTTHPLRRFYNPQIENVLTIHRRLLHRGSIPFEIPQLNFRGKTEGDGILIGYNEDDKSLSIPLAILSVSQGLSRNNVVF